MATQYEAGKCNIGPEEVNYRRKVVGYGAGLIALALYIMLVYFNFPIIMYSVLYIPVFVSIHGIREARRQFCTSYARSGKYNMTSEVGMTLDVVGPTKRKKDQVYAAKLTNASLRISAVVTIALIAASRIVN